MSKLHLVLLIHAHQPVGNFDSVLEKCYQRSYLPFVECLERHPSIRLGLHYSGPLLEWIEQSHPEYFEVLRRLVARGQAELIGGGFYEPILIAIPPEDQWEQLRRMADYLERWFGLRPKGAWLAERVWEPQLPAVMAEAGVDYTLVDDFHFLAGGFELQQLHGVYIAEDRGKTVKVIPGLKGLRYLIPFRPVEDTIEFLRGVAREHPDGLAAMGDDCEKFGVWPGTYDYCYRDGWLERFFTALEANAGWLVTSPPGEYLSTHPPLGRADLPTASYTEMMEWALPTAVRVRFHTLQQEFGSRSDVQQFLRGGFWRGFFSKYAEANLLHKKMLYVSEKIRRLASLRRGQVVRRRLGEASTHLLRSQCNDAYWHGVFGGLYSPHLRTALWHELVLAETLADAVDHGRTRYVEIQRLDFDADGVEEVYVTSPEFAALLKPADGGTLAALDAREHGITLVNSLQRRLEAYHTRVRDTAGDVGAVASIHEQVRVKEEGLRRCLRYDRWARHAFRLLLFAPEKTYQDYQALRLKENAEFAAGIYDVAFASAEKVELVRESPLAAPAAGTAADASLRAVKTFSFSGSPDGFWIACDLELAERSAEPHQLQIGLEVVINLLAPNEPDRYFETGGRRYPLEWGGAVPASELRLIDAWQKVAVTLEAPQAHQFWIAPIETVSESEEGFERVYQGSQILVVWSAELGAQAVWKGRVVVHVAPLR